jgi:hypothetical protein
MLYAISKRPDGATGLFENDPAPAHLQCESPLHFDDQSRQWFCVPCRSIGHLILAEPLPRAATHASPTALERMQQRWDQVWPGSHEVPDLSDPTTWEPFLKTYCARGVWLMRALDDVQHTIADDSFLYLGFDISVGLGDDEYDLPEIAIMDVNSLHPRFLKETVSIRKLDFGILLLTNDKGEHVRLDAHTNAEDEQAVDTAREQYYGSSNPYRTAEDEA